MKAWTEERLKAVVNEAITSSPMWADVKSDINVLKSDVSVLKSDVSGLKGEMHIVRLMLEDLQSSMRRVIEVMTSWGKKAERIDTHEQALDHLRSDVDITQGALKGHIADKRLHRLS